MAGTAALDRPGAEATVPLTRAPRDASVVVGRVALDAPPAAAWARLTAAFEGAPHDHQVRLGPGKITLSSIGPATTAVYRLPVRAGRMAGWFISEPTLRRRQERLVEDHLPALARAFAAPARVSRAGERCAMPRVSSRVFAAAVATVCLAVLAPPLRADDPARRGLEIARSADRANQGFQGERTTMAMEIINAHGDITRRRLKVETLEGSDDGDKAKVVIESPTDVRGTKLLTWNHRQREADQWLYLPAIKRVRRIGGSNKRSGFVGSEFSYEDLASAEVDRFTYKYLDEPVLDGRPTFRLERYPVDRDSAYGRQVVWLDKQHQNPLRVEYHDRGGVLLKRATFQGYRAHGRWWRPDAVVMENLQTRKKSIIRWEDRQLGLTLAPASFDSARLED